MEKRINVARALILSTRLYRALLGFYPSEFRQAFGDPMLQVFRDCSLRALRESGAAGLLSLWIRTILDTLKSALEEHIQRGVDMSKSKFLKLCGWALILGSLALMLGWLASSRPDYHPFNAHSLPIDRYANAVEYPLIVMGMLLLSVGFIGLYIRYGQAVGIFGRISLALGVLSGVVSAVGTIGLRIIDSNPWWSMFSLGMILQFVGLLLFGIANLRPRTLPRWNSLPILAGVWIPLFVLLGLFGLPVLAGWEVPDAVFVALLLVSLAGVTSLGYLLQSDSQPAGTPAAAI